VLSRWAYDWIRAVGSGVHVHLKRINSNNWLKRAFQKKIIIKLYIHSYII
jgi:hypothetical protein